MSDQLADLDMNIAHAIETPCRLLSNGMVRRRSLLRSIRRRNKSEAPIDQMAQKRDQVRYAKVDSEIPKLLKVLRKKLLQEIEKYEETANIGKVG